MAVYLLHSTVKIGTAGRNSAQHYIGFSEDHNLWQRLSHHADPRKKTAKIIEAFHKVGAELLLVRVWADGGRALETHLKSRGKYKSRCPICQGWEPASKFLSLATIRSMTLTSGVRLLDVPALATSGRRSGGTPITNSGLSLVHPMQEGPTEFGGAVFLVSVAPTGGMSTSATALPSDRASAYVGTKLRRSSGAST